MEDEKYMRRALELARKGWGFTNPNPMVGAVLVKDGKIVGEGFHKAAGQAHAEVDAIKNAGEEAAGSELYVNLEPCSHYGRTPPCVNAIIEARIKKVVVAMEDPNPLVSGEGIRILKKAGIEVEAGVLEKEARKLNEVFIKNITTHMPFIAIKAAMSIDGKVATATGESRWISSSKSREYVHYLRTGYDGIMVGINTVLKDDPLLTSRLGDFPKKNPVRIVVDSEAKIPLEAKMLKDIASAPVIVATTSRASEKKLEELKARGVEVKILEDCRGKVDLYKLVRKLAQEGITSILVEGGGTLNWSLLEARLVDKILIFLAPKIIGGRNAPTPVDGKGITKVQSSIKVSEINITHFENDILIEGYPCYREV